MTYFTEGCSSALYSMLADVQQLVEKQPREIKMKVRTEF